MKWISIKDKIPPSEEKKILATDGKNIWTLERTIKEGLCETDIFWNVHKGSCKCCVMTCIQRFSHWMPFPKDLNTYQNQCPEKT